MKLKIFTFPFSNRAGGFDDGPMQDFINDKEVIDFSEHFFVHEKKPWLAVLISYRALSRPPGRKVADRADPRKTLDGPEKIAYDALRTWRLARSRQEGIPPYLIASNRQVAQMVKIGARTKTALTSISGIGDRKVAAYGDDILQILAEHLPDLPSPASEEKG